MQITISSSRLNDEQAIEVREFMKTLLPRLEQAEGVVAVYHFQRTGTDEYSTIVVWRDEVAAASYRESDLAAESRAFDARVRLDASREMHDLRYPITIGEEGGDGAQGDVP